MYIVGNLKVTDMINAQLKDDLLKRIVNDRLAFNLNAQEIATDLKCDIREVFLILEYFQRKGLIEAYGSDGGTAWGRTRVEAFDLCQAGGYVGQEELLQNNIKKLLLEIESLKPTMPDKVSQISTIAANVVTALTLFTK